MTALVIYATRHGTTRRVAEAIADGIRAHDIADVRSVAEAEPLSEGVDLLVIGGPTEAHRITPDLLDFLQRLPADAVRGTRAGAFETRLDWPKWLSGSAADTIGRRLAQLGAIDPVPTESFFVSFDPDIRPTELDRARAWGAQLATGSARHIEPTPTTAGH